MVTRMRATAGVPPSDLVAYGQTRGRWVLVATVLGSSLVFIDGTVVNIALPAITHDFGAGLQAATWVVNSYALSLAALILLGGALADRYGRRRIFLLGTVWFTAASVICAVAPNVETLIIARALQGVGGALLTPASLAIIQASFGVDDRSRAVGAWSGLAAVTGAISPLIGGWLLLGSWRFIFLINVPIAVLVVLAARHVPETRNTRSRGLDPLGTALAALILSLVTIGFGAWTTHPIGTPPVSGPFTAGAVVLVLFVLWERRAARPLLPPVLLGSRLFVAVNAVTFLVYSALSGAFFWVVIYLQVVAGFSPLASGLALVPMTMVMLLFSARASAWGQRVGPRLPMTIGPGLSAVGVALLTRLDADTHYGSEVLPPVLIFAAGLVITVGPLTAVALSAAPDAHAGLASAANNTVARAGGLLAVAALPALTGLAGTYTDAAALHDAYAPAMWLCVALLAAAAVAAAVAIDRPSKPPR